VIGTGFPVSILPKPIFPQTLSQRWQRSLKMA
jgi:hypothetical protein